MQRPRKDNVIRVRVSTSLDPEDKAFLDKIGASSDSYNLALLVRAARLAKLKVNDVVGGGDALDEFNEFLRTKKTKAAKELQALLQEFLDSRG